VAFFFGLLFIYIYFCYNKVDEYSLKKRLLIYLNKKNMDRKEFLSLLGMGGASLVVSACLGGCSKNESTTAPTNIDLNLELTSSAYSKLKTKGQYVQLEGVVVAYGLDGNYYAAQLTCPHESGRIKYDSSVNKFRCEKHDAQTFSQTGSSFGPETSSSLKTYVCTLTNNGNTLNVKG
jgi:cytochrome b6-f complex iron-sulfur subunit